METLELIFTLYAGLLGTLLLIVVKLLLSLNAKIDMHERFDKQRQRSDERFDKQQQRSDERFDIHTKRLAEVHAEILANRGETRANREQIRGNRKELDTFRDETRE